MRKKLTIRVQKDGTWGNTLKSWDVWVQLDSECMFYCYPPKEFLPLLGDRRTRPADLQPLTHRKKEGCFGAQSFEALERGLQQAAQGAQSFEALERGLQQAAQIVARPEISVEQVIRYTITSTSRYAKNAEGEIAPNAVGAGFEWVQAALPRRGFGERVVAGLLIGAGVFEKTTTKLGERIDDEYELWYGADENGKPYDHWGTESPAGVLNHWSPNGSADVYEQEMPYSDEAALWFIGAMKQIAILSDMVLTRLSEGGIQRLMNSWRPSKELAVSPAGRSNHGNRSN